MSEKQYYSYEEIKDLLRKIVEEELNEKIQCNRCKRYFDQDEDIIYFVSVTEEEFNERIGFLVCFECRDEIKNVRMEQMI